MKYSEIFAEQLLFIDAVKLSPDKPFTWASGWLSPIYCDNRLTLSYPNIRATIVDGLLEIIKLHYPNVTAIAAVATAGIPHGMLVADRLNLPFVYVRNAPKSHGLSNKIEGKIDTNGNYVVIEDLISTGSSSLQSVAALRDAGCNVLGLAALFTYQLEEAALRFKEMKCDYFTISTYSKLIEMALNNNYITPQHIAKLELWRAAPADWGK